MFRTTTCMTQFVTVLAVLVLSLPALAQAGEQAVVIPAPLLDNPKASGPLRRLLLGRPGRLSARARGPRGAVGLRGRHQGDGALPDGQPRHHGPRGVGGDPLRSEGGLLRRDPPDLLLRGPRPDPARSSGPRHGAAVPLEHLLRRRRAAESRPGLSCPTRQDLALRARDRDARRCARGLLSGRALSPGLPRPQPALSLYRDQRPAQDRELPDALP